MITACTRRWAGLCAGLFVVGAALPLGAQLARREGDAEERRRALIEQWDGVAGADEANTGVSFGVWLRAVGRGAGGARLSVTVPQAQRWTSIGPQAFFGPNGLYGSLPQTDAGRVPALAFHPTDRNTLYVGTAAGGVWKSTNEGASWVPLTDTECSLVIGAIAVDPVNPDIVYAATGEPSEGTAGCGVLRSTDAGSTWSTFGQSVFTTSAASAATAYAMVIDRASAGSAQSTTVVVATNRGVMRSTNSGQTWSLVTPALTFSDVKQHPTDPTVMYAARYGVQGSGTPPGLWRSRDRGATWAPVTTFTTDSVVRMEIAVSADRPGSVWMLSGRPDRAFGGLWRWDDDTGTRTALEANGLTAPAANSRLNFGEQSEYNLMIAVDPADANIVYVAGVRAYRSTDGGSTFREMAPTIHVDWHAIAIDQRDPTRVFVGNDGGAFLSRDRGFSFQSVNDGLATSLHYPGLSLHPTDPTGVLTGLQDNGTLIARNGMVQFNGINGGDGAFTATNPVNPDIVYVSSQRGSLVRIDRSTGSARGISVSTTVEPRRSFIAPFVLDPQRATRLYFGGARLFRTENEGTSWTPISPDLTNGSGTINAIAVAPSDSSALFVGTTDGNVRFSRDFGATWQAPTTPMPARTITDFAIDPTDASRVVVTVGGAGTPHVYLSRNGGTTFTDITGTLPDVTTQAAAWGPGGRLYVGNMFGVYESANDGVTWTRNTGLPTIRVTDLVYNARTNRLVAATYGRGLWAYDFTAPTAVLRGDVNADGVVNAADALLIQQALIGVQVPSNVTLFPAADANCDGRMEVLDALLVLRFAVGDASGGACVGERR